MAGGRPKLLLENIECDGWDLLDALCIWATAEYCAEQLGISSDTLVWRIEDRYGISYPEYKTKRREPLMVNLFRRQYEVAMGGNTTMLIWLGKNYLNQSDQQKATIESLEPIKIEFIERESKRDEIDS